MYKNIEDSIFLLKECIDYKYLRENLSDIELLTMESILEQCKLVDNRPNNWNDYISVDFPYDYIDEECNIPIFDVVVPEKYNFQKESILRVLLWYENLEDTDYVVEIVKDMSSGLYDNLESAIQTCLNENYFSIETSPFDKECLAVNFFNKIDSECCLARMKTYNVSPEEFIKREGLKEISFEISFFIKELSASPDFEDVQLAEEILTSMKEYLHHSIYFSSEDVNQPHLFDKCIDEILNNSNMQNKKVLDEEEMGL